MYAEQKQKQTSVCLLQDTETSDHLKRDRLNGTRTCNKPIRLCQEYCRSRASFIGHVVNSHVTTRLPVHPPGYQPSNYIRNYNY